jgi:proteasome lid subunit RPN8/RPN11
MATMSEQHPWLDGDLEITRDVIAAIDAHAIEAYPEESCGFLIGPGDAPKRVDEAVRAQNLANKYHALDPETFPRTAKTFFLIDARVIYRTFEEGESRRRPVKVIYHSHCDVGAYFSSEDQAAGAPDGVLSYPVTYIVTSVRDRVVDDHKVFSFREGKWVEVAFRVVG